MSQKVHNCSAFAFVDVYRPKTRPRYLAFANQVPPMTALESPTDSFMNTVGWTAGRLAAEMPTLATEKTCAEVFDWFNDHPAQVAAAVVDRGDRIQGIVNRLRFLASYAQRYVPELNGKQSIMKMANPKPLIVDESV